MRKGRTRKKTWTMRTIEDEEDEDLRSSVVLFFIIFFFVLFFIIFFFVRLVLISLAQPYIITCRVGS